MLQQEDHAEILELNLKIITSMLNYHVNQSVNQSINQSFNVAVHYVTENNDLQNSNFLELRITKPVFCLFLYFSS